MGSRPPETKLIGVHLTGDVGESNHLEFPPESGEGRRNRPLKPCCMALELFRRNRIQLLGRVRRPSSGGESWFLLRVTQLKASNLIRVITSRYSSERMNMARASWKTMWCSWRDSRSELESLAGKLMDVRNRNGNGSHGSCTTTSINGWRCRPWNWRRLSRPLSPSISPAVAQLAVVRAHVSGLSDDLHDLACILVASVFTGACAGLGWRCGTMSRNLQRAPVSASILPLMMRRTTWIGGRD